MSASGGSLRLTGGRALRSAAAPELIRFRELGPPHYRNEGAGDAGEGKDAAPRAAEDWEWRAVGAQRGGELAVGERQGHTSVAVGGLLVVFGGCTLLNNCYNDVTTLWSKEH